MCLKTSALSFKFRKIWHLFLNTSIYILVVCVYPAAKTTKVSCCFRDMSYLYPEAYFTTLHTASEARGRDSSLHHVVFHPDQN